MPERSRKQFGVCIVFCVLGKVLQARMLASGEMQA
jgi:hypothetical protein